MPIWNNSAHLLFRRPLITLVAAILVISADPRCALANYSTQTQDLSNRLSQAHELLGRHYPKSVVRTGEKVKDVRGFVRDWVQKSLPKPWRKSAAQIAQAVMTESRTHELDPLFLLAVIAKESSFRPDARGTSGELGLMQLMPATGEWIARKMEIKYHGPRTLRDPVQNIRIGAAYLAYLREKFDFHGRLYLSAYNMGATHVNDALDRQIWPKEYSNLVMKNYILLYGELKMSQNPERKPSSTGDAGKTKGARPYAWVD